MMAKLTRQFFALLYDVLLHPDDNPMDRTRKFALALVMLSTPGGFLCSLVFAYYGFVETDTTLYAMALLWFCSGWTVIFVWLHIRRTKMFPNYLVDIMLYSMMSVIFVGYLVVQHEVFFFLMFTTAVAGALVQPTSQRLFFVISTAQLSVWAYNSSIPLFVPGTSVLSLSGLYNPGFLAVLLSLMGVLTNALVYWCVHFQNKAFIFAINHSSVSRDMCMTVSQKLIRYDVDGAKESIELFRMHGWNDVEPDTYNSLVNLVTNLERFRPHLPSYILEDTEEMQESQLELTRRITRCVPQDSIISSSFSDDQVVNEASDNTRLCAFDSLANPGGNSDPGGGSTSHRTLDSNTSSRVVIENPSLTAPSEEVHDITKCVVTITLLNDIQRKSSMHTVVNRLYGFALPTQATIHSYVGDTVHITWNTSRRTVQHSSKGALFLAWLQKDSGDEHVRSYGAVSTGPARSFYAGDRHSMLLVQTEWEGRMWMLHGLAVRYNACVMCQGVNEVAKAFVETYWVDTMVEPENVGTSRQQTFSVYELIRERPGSDEWMYSLEALTKTEDSHPLTQAMKNVQRGDYSIALAALLVIPPKEYTLLDRRLEKKVRKAIADNVAVKDFPLLRVEELEY